MLPISTICFWWHCDSGYYINSLKLSRIAAVRTDEEIKIATKHKVDELSSPGENFRDTTLSYGPDFSTLHLPDPDTNYVDSDEESCDSDDKEFLTEAEMQARLESKIAKKKKLEALGDIVTKGFERSAYAQKCISEKPKLPEPFEYDSQVTSAKSLNVGSFLSRSGGEATMRKSPTKVYDSSGSDLSTSLINPTDLEKGDA